MKIGTKLKVTTLVVLALLILNAGIGGVFVRRMIQEAEQLEADGQLEKLVLDMGTITHKAVRSVLHHARHPDPVHQASFVYSEQELRRLRQALHEFAGEREFDEILVRIESEFSQLDVLGKSVMSRGTERDRALTSVLTNVEAIDRWITDEIESSNGGDSEGLETETLLDLEVHLEKVMVAVESYVVWPKPEGRSSLEASTEAFRGSFLDGARVEGLESIRDGFESVERDAKQVLALTDELVTELLRVEALAGSLDQLLHDECHRVLAGRVATARAETVSNGRKSIAVTVATSVAILTTMAAIVALITRGLTRSARRLRAGAQEFGNLNFEHRVEVPIEDELADLAGSFNEMAAQLQDSTASRQQLLMTLERAEKMSQIRGDFLAKMSHELRTPLNAIIGFNRRVVKRCAQTLAERDLDALETVSKNSHHLLALIDDLLDYAHLDSGKVTLDYARFKIGELVVEVLCRLRATVGNSPVALRTLVSPCDIEIHADRRRLSQVLTNLISNAIKYTHEGEIRATAELSTLTFGDVEVPAVRVAVNDTGSGISKDAMETLFQFNRVDTNAPGAGLGLAITEQLIRLHRGQIWVKSEPDQGSEFSFAIPIEKVGARVPSSRPMSASKQERQKGGRLS